MSDPNLLVTPRLNPYDRTDDWKNALAFPEFRDEIADGLQLGAWTSVLTGAMA